MLRTFHFFTIFLTIFLSFSSCSLASGLGDFDPKTFNVIRNKSGGMHPSGSRISISHDGAYYQKHWEEKGQYKTSYAPFSVTEAELKNLYSVIQKNRFTSISTFKEKVYDRGGVSIVVKNGKNSITKNNSGMNFVKKSHQDRYSKVGSAIGVLAGEKTTGSDASILVKVKNANRFNQMVLFVNDIAVRGNWNSSQTEAIIKIPAGKYKIKFQWGIYVPAKNENEKAKFDYKEISKEVMAGKDSEHKGLLFQVDEQGQVSFASFDFNS